MNKSERQKRREAKAKRAKKPSEAKDQNIALPIPTKTEAVKEAEKAANANTQENKEQCAKQTRLQGKANRMILVLAVVCSLLFAVALGFALKDGSLTRVFWSWIFVVIFAVLAIAFYAQAYFVGPKEIAKTEAAKTESPVVPLRGLLIPANDPTPPNPCGETPPGNIAIYMGGAAALSFYPTPIILQVGEETLLGFERTTDGLVVNAAIYSPEGEEVARITRNAIRVTPRSGYYAERPDPHTLVVLDPHDQRALYVRYLNPTAVKVLGIFYRNGALYAVFDERGQQVGEAVISGICYNMRNAGVLFHIDP